MHIQKGLRKKSILKKYGIGSHPIIQHFIDRLQIREIISSFIDQDGRTTLDIEKALVVLIHNILSSPVPMYEIADWMSPLSEECIGLEVGEGSLIQDDRIGKALDAFYEGRHKDVFFRLALRAIKIFDLDCSQIHQDTTTVTFSGRYSGWTAQERLDFGHNKDHRPDLKQLVLGMSVTADGSVPLVHEIYNGNQTDDRIHPSNHLRLRKLLDRSDFVYVADCKLATSENLAKISGCGGIFVTVMPRTWKEDKAFRNLVKGGQVKWELLLLRKNNRKPTTKVDHYSLAKGDYRSTSQGHRIFWILSTQKAEQDAETRNRQIQKALDGLKSIQARLNRYSLKERSAIQREILKVLKESCSQKRIQWSLHSHRQYQVKHTKRGRPKKDAVTPIKKCWSQFFSLSYSLDEQAILDEKMSDGIFPLITNAPEKDFDAKRVLEIYKFQPFLEKRHTQLKTWQQVTPVLLKKSERVVAYLHMHVIALMVATLIERALRMAMRKNKIGALPLYPENRPCKYPTLYDLVRLFRNLERYEVEDSSGVTLFPAQLTPLQKEVLKLLEVPLSLYQ
jgi:transposase